MVITKELIKKEIDKVPSKHLDNLYKIIKSLQNGQDYTSYFRYITSLVEQSEIIIDRPKGSTHPRYNYYIYPLDYGYLAGTTSSDGSGIDLWRGSMGINKVTGILCTIDLEKRDSEIKILLDCTDAEIEMVLKAHNTENSQALLMRND